MKPEGRDRAKKDKGRGIYPGDADPWGMKEKYFHSLGAALCEEGRFAEAAEALRQAIEIEETPYSRYQSAMAFRGMKDPDAALREMDRAIELAPGTPEYYYERSLMRRDRGDGREASADLAKAIAIDGNYGRIQEIRDAIHTVRHGFDDPDLEDWCHGVRTKDSRLRRMVDDLSGSLRSRYDLVSRSSCPVGVCPAYCCHFAGPMVRHGVVIGAWKLNCIRTYLKDRSLSPEQFLDRLPWDGEGFLRELVSPPYFIREGRSHFVFFPVRAAAPIDRNLLKDLPKGQDYQTLMWINEKARPCAFLTGGQCMIHDTGDEAGLPACKQFLCLTGLVFVVLGHLGMDKSILSPVSDMARLNRFAVEALLILSSDIYGHHDTVRAEKARTRALKASVNAEKKGDVSLLGAKIDEYSRLCRELDDLLSARTERARKKLEALSPLIKG